MAHHALARRIANVLALGLGWCLAMSGVFINISTTTVATTDFTGNAYLATIPIGAQLLGAAACLAPVGATCSPQPQPSPSASLAAVPLGRLAQSRGRRPVYIGAALMAAAGSAVLVAGAVRRQFGLLVLGALMQGPSFAVANGFRFVAAEFFTGCGYTAAWRARAISLSVGMAVFAAGIGPEAVRHVRYALDKPYAGSYVLVVGLYLAQALVTGLVQHGWLHSQQQQQQQPAVVAMKVTPDSAEAQGAGSPGAPLTCQPSNSPDKLACPPSQQVILLQPPPFVAPQPALGQAGGPGQAAQRPVRDMLSSLEFLVPAVSGAVSFCTMAALMAAAPVAMQLDGHSYERSTYAIEVHIVGMYLPAMFVGDFMAGLRCLVTLSPVWLTPLLLLLPPMHPWRVHQDSRQHPDPADLPPSQQQQQQQQQQPPLCKTALQNGQHQGCVNGNAAHTAAQEQQEAVKAPLGSVTLQLQPPLMGPLPVPAASRAGWAASSAPSTATVVLGALVLIAAGGVMRAGAGFGHYGTGMALLGVGWALVYVAASAMVTAVFVREPHLRLAVQGGMDTLVVTMSAVANATAGTLVKAMSWQHFVELNMATNAVLALANLGYHLHLGRCHGLQGSGPRGTDHLRGRVVLVDEHHTTRVSSAVNGKQPCEEELNHEQPTKRAGWKPPAGQVEHRLLRPAWSQQRDQPVRGLMWCPIVAPRKPPQAPRSSQEASQPAASEPGPSTPLPAKRSKRTKAEPAAEPTQPTKAAKAKPAPQPGRWLDRDCNAVLNMQRNGESR
ncbi:hypothetical protein QJQ45_010142 [Haematococcus lacustris]|nr:hypothetical protein QJQ45_010142 [Haematococcus lacustris]